MTGHIRAQTKPKNRPPTPTALPPPKSLNHTGVLSYLRNRLLENLFSSRFYPALLRGPQKLLGLHSGTDPWPGDTNRANALLQGRFRFAHCDVKLSNQMPWAIHPPSPEWAAEVATFAWLRDFRDEGGQAARKGARQLTHSWMEQCGHWQPLAWRPDILGRRLLAWCSHADFLLEGANPKFRNAFQSSLAQQARHLRFAWRLAPSGAGTLSALIGLSAVYNCFDAQDRKAKSFLELLEAEMHTQVLGDGCHISRNPSDQLMLLRELIWLRAILSSIQEPIPTALTSTIEHMGPMLGFFRQGNGSLALFHGSVEEDPVTITETLAAFPGKMRPRSRAPHGRFERLASGPSLVILDTGPPAPDPFSASAHASTLALEFSVGRERLVVNCGHRASGSWQDASRTTAAHSTLTLGDTNSSEVVRSGMGARANEITVHRQEDEGNLWLDAEHNGYALRYGLFHRRRLYLTADGTVLRGQDILEGPGNGKVPANFAVRFHLHPDVDASLTTDGALLRLPGGTGWRFRFTGGDLALEESVYLGRRDNARRTEQIVLTGSVAPGGSTLKWAFARI